MAGGFGRPVDIRLFKYHLLQIEAIPSKEWFSGLDERKRNEFEFDDKYRDRLKPDGN